jgi:SAM-dependent methyltransferase
MTFKNAQESHEHSLETLNQLYQYDDFMASLKTMVDLGCGEGHDLEWWSTLTTRDDDATPLNIKCTGVDLIDNVPAAKKYANTTYHKGSFEDTLYPPPEKFDVLWCHNSFQYALNPLKTLANWHDIASPGGMLALVVPQTTNIHRRDLDFSQVDGVYHHHTIVSLIHMLAVTGWDCKGGFFKKSATDNWLYAVVYKSSHAPMDPATTRWYDLVEKGLLPDSADKSINAKGFLEQKDLIVPWLDKSLSWLGQQ